MYIEVLLQAGITLGPGVTVRKGNICLPWGMYGVAAETKQIKQISFNLFIQVLVTASVQNQVMV